MFFSDFSKTVHDFLSKVFAPNIFCLKVKNWVKGGFICFVKSFYIGFLIELSVFSKMHLGKQI